MSLQKLIFIQHPINTNNSTGWKQQINQILDQVNHFNPNTTYYFYIFQTLENNTLLSLKSIENVLILGYSSLITYFSKKNQKVPNWDLNIAFDKFSKGWLFNKVRGGDIEDLEVWMPKNIGFEQLYNYLNIASENTLKDRVKQYNLENSSSHLNIKPSPEEEEEGEKFEASGEYGALGGTFDHLHPGHKILLSISSIAVSRELFCGVMAPETLKSKKYGELVESIEFRLEKVKNFIKFFNFNLKFKVEPIYDGFGPTITDSGFDTIILTEETAKGGDLVNEKRMEKGWSPLKQIIVKLISEEDGNVSKSKEEEIKSKLSSTSIRKRLHELNEENSSNNN